MTHPFSRPRPATTLLLVLLVLGLCAAPADAALGAGLATSPALSQASGSGKVIVAFANSEQSEAQVAAELASRGLTLDKWLPELGLARATVQPGSGGAAAAAERARAQTPQLTL